MNFKQFSNTIILWYALAKRDLPWRHTQNPYLIWISEIILQQTRVSQGLPYYLKFSEKYPTIKDLANADEQEILRLWQGLGYYTRARNMLQTAKSIQKDLEGQFPGSFKELIKLKGIGKYTAGAIASFAYNEIVPVVDGNVMRVLARVFGLYEDISTLNGQKEFLRFASALLPKENCQDFNQGVMEFGAMVCTPRAPKCESCVLGLSCHAYLHETIALLPVKNNKLKKRTRKISFFVIMYKGKILMHKRKEDDIWKGLYQFYSVEDHHEKISDFLPDQLLDSILLFKDAQVKEPATTYKHLLTHQIILAQYWELTVDNKIDERVLEKVGLSYFSLDEVQELPKPILIVNYLNKK